MLDVALMKKRFMEALWTFDSDRSPTRNTSATRIQGTQCPDRLLCGGLFASAVGS